MLQLLDSNGQRINHIITLLSNNNDWHYSKDLADDLGVSLRTISNDIKIIKTRWGDLLQIESSPTKGVRILSHSEKVRNLITKTLILESNFASLLICMVLYPHHNLEYYSEKLFISKSTISRLIPKINEYIEPLDFHISLSPKGYELKAKNEAYLRKFFMHFFADLFGIEFKKVSLDIDYDYLEKFTRSRLLKYNFVYSESIFIFFTYLTLITLIRENHGFHLECDLRNDQDPLALNQFKYDFPYISDSSLCTIEFSLLEYSTEHLTQTSIDKAINVFFNDIEDKFQLIIPDKDKTSIGTYLKNIYFKFQAYPFNVSMSLDRVNEFGEAIKKENPRTMEKFSSIIMNFTESADLNYDLALNSILYWVISHVPEIVSTPNKTKNILYFSDLGLRHGEFIARLIRSTFRAYANHADMVVEVASSDTALKLDKLSEYDCILTNLKNLDLPLDNILIINDYPSEQDFIRILHMLNE